MKEEIEWSPKAEEHLALLQQSRPSTLSETPRQRFEEAAIRLCTPPPAPLCGRRTELKVIQHALIADPSSVTVVESGWQATRGEDGTLVLVRSSPADRAHGSPVCRHRA